MVGFDPFENFNFRLFRWFKELIAHGAKNPWCPTFLVSDDFKDLFFRMFENDPAKRLTLKQVAAHPWVTADNLPSQEELHQEALKLNLIREKEFA